MVLLLEGPGKVDRFEVEVVWVDIEELARASPDDLNIFAIMAKRKLR